MFYYLILNSSPLKKKNQKDKMVFTLIGGSLIYLVLHAFVSFSFKNDLVKYIWFLFLIDVSAVFLSSDFQGFSSIQISQNTSGTDTYIEPDIEETKKNTKFNSQTHNLNQNFNDEESSKPLKINSKKTRKKILKKNREPRLQENNNISNQLNKKPKKQVKFEESTPIKDLSSSQKDTYNQEEAENINLTLESLENLNLELSYPDENTNHNNTVNRDNYKIPKTNKKKMEDEYSDIGSELDLEKFENSIANN